MDEASRGDKRTCSGKLALARCRVNMNNAFVDLRLVMPFAMAHTPDDLISGNLALRTIPVVLHISNTTYF